MPFPLSGCRSTIERASASSSAADFRSSFAAKAIASSTSAAARLSFDSMRETAAFARETISAGLIHGGIVREPGTRKNF
jgi:hypothetical protein